MTTASPIVIDRVQHVSRISKERAACLASHGNADDHDFATSWLFGNAHSARLRARPDGAILRIMPLVSPIAAHPLIDGRQSDRAMMVRRGIQRLLVDLNIASLPEVSLASGRRADLVALGPGGTLWIIEIKTSIEDFRVDRKWPEYHQYCDRLYFATHPGVPDAIFPEECGLMLSDGFGAEILREAPEQRLAPATRKAMTLRFAQTAAQRLTRAEWAVGCDGFGA